MASHSSTASAEVEVHFLQLSLIWEGCCPQRPKKAAGTAASILATVVVYLFQPISVGGRQCIEPPVYSQMLSRDFSHNLYA